MSSFVVYPQGKARVVVPATESIAVYSKGIAQVSIVLGYPNYPESVDVLGVVNNGQTVFGPYASGATIIIDAGAAQALYQVGASPVVTELYDSRLQADPVAVNVTGSVSAAAILGGLVTSTTAAAVAGTIPTGTVMDAASELAINEAVVWTVINTGGTNAFTVTAASGHTIVGAAAVAANTSGSFLTRKTAANTFVTYRL